VDGDSAPGVAHEELAKLSHHVDLLVVGRCSYGPLRRPLLGSTSAKLVHEAACPVLVLPRGIKEPDEAPAAAASAGSGAGTA
jgi:nucleotide-binding universal stress UspA family protein